MNLDNLLPKKFIFGLWSGTLVINQKNLQFWISICDLIFTISLWLETYDHYVYGLQLGKIVGYFLPFQFNFFLLYRVKLHVLWGVPWELKKK